MTAKHIPEQVPAARAIRRILSKRQLLKIIPLSYPTIWSMMRRDEFPRSIVVGPNGKVGWYDDEVEEWVESRQRSKLKPAADPAAIPATP